MPKKIFLISLIIPLGILLVGNARGVEATQVKVRALKAKADLNQWRMAAEWMLLSAGCPKKSIDQTPLTCQEEVFLKGALEPPVGYSYHSFQSDCQTPGATAENYCLKAVGFEKGGVFVCKKGACYCQPEGKCKDKAGPQLVVGGWLKLILPPLIWILLVILSWSFISSEKVSPKERQKLSPSQIKKGNRFAIASFISGIISVFFFVLSSLLMGLSFLLFLPPLFLSQQALRAGTSPKIKFLAYTGFVLSMISLLEVILVFAYLVF